MVGLRRPSLLRLVLEEIAVARSIGALAAVCESLKRRREDLRPTVHGSVSFSAAGAAFLRRVSMCCRVGRYRCERCRHRSDARTLYAGTVAAPRGAMRVANAPVPALQHALRFTR